jgi:hypothetical protein
MEDLHPYDGVDRRFRHDDPDPAVRARARALVARLLRLPGAPPPGLRCDLLFTSGGAGVHDRLHIAVPCAADEAAAIAARLGHLALDAAWDRGERDELEWLIQDEDHPGRSPAAHAAAFIADRRGDLMPAPREDAPMWFAPGSDVNAWSLLYFVDGELAYLAEDTG